jgi:hypothetical protein
MEEIDQNNSKPKDKKFLNKKKIKTRKISKKIKS